MKTTTVVQMSGRVLLPTVLAIGLADGTTAGQAVLTSHVEHWSAPEKFRAPHFTQMEDTRTRAYSEQASQWTKAMAKRFRELVRKDAFGDLTNAESLELEQLARDRRNLLHPRTIEEVLWEAKQREVTAKLLEALREYVEFHQATH
ncbi:MAG: hypothetical protein QHJ82_04780 [Verrucomicrobiota bacterium]|nr:hypothetical protein [Verrucomicrobiota bacterium]